MKRKLKEDKVVKKVTVMIDKLILKHNETICYNHWKLYGILSKKQEWS